ncbi:MAG: FAD-dependent oxidoreductase [Bacteroidetes bacterium]|nr:FAD-dependent oxidoreductase [Bacteroidota bacterium]
MKLPVNPEKIVQFKGMREPLSLQAVIKESNRCLLCFDAPCSEGCPAGTDPAKFIRQIKFYNYKGAARTIRNNNILGSVCAFVCPVEKLCEKKCSIKALEDPINISGLQRFASEYGQRFEIEPPAQSLKSEGRIAIIGGGPAGMGCASALAKMDYEVTVFERENLTGGVPRWNIPGFRLPEEALVYDVKNLISQGVEIRHKSPVETPEAVTNLLAEGYDSVFISSGLSVAFKLDMLNGYSNVTDYITFLRKVKFGNESLNLKNKNVAIIGGGSVAIDSAVSAKACGANKVYLISLEHLSELPADKEEINLARIMDIIFKSGSQITGVVENENGLSGLTGIETDWIEPGKFIPLNARQISGTEFRINIDLVVQAIGTKPGNEIMILAKGLKTIGKGIIEVNEDFETNIPGVFAGGDVVNGGATVVQAVGEGKKAAQSIDNFLKNRRTSK